MPACTPPLDGALAREHRQGLAGHGTDVALRGVPPHYDEDGEDSEEDADPRQASGPPADEFTAPPREHDPDKPADDDRVLELMHRGLLACGLPRSVPASTASSTVH